MKDAGTAKREITLGSLFDGAGGFPLAGTLAGITPKWASEIEPFPIRVTTKRFPEMRHIGNITEVSGADIEPVDIITFGSPCQDLSVANCVGVESTLSQILEPTAPEKYNLSATACAGILRRARERGKRLPELLEAVLTHQSQGA